MSLESCPHCNSLNGLHLERMTGDTVCLNCGYRKLTNGRITAIVTQSPISRLSGMDYPSKTQLKAAIAKLPKEGPSVWTRTAPNERSKANWSAKTVSTKTTGSEEGS